MKFNYEKDLFGLKDGKKRRVAAYCRVSTENELQQSSLKNQKSYFDSFINKQKNWKNVGIYYDEGISGTQLKNRTNLLRIYHDALDGKIDLIIIKNVSRFARNTKDALVLTDELRRNNVGIYFIESDFYTLDRSRDMEYTMNLGYAQQESIITSNHVRTALEMKSVKGEVVNFRGCYGLEWDKDLHKIVVIQKEAKIVKEIFNMYVKEGLGTKTIAKKLTERGIKTKRGATKWDGATISGILHNVKYIGNTKYGITYTTDPILKIRKRNLGEEKTIDIENTHDAIISEEIFNEAQKILNNRGGFQKNGHKSTSNMFAFSEKIQCGFCGKNYYHKYQNSNTKYRKPIWACTSYSKEGKKACPDSKKIDDDILKEAFVVSFNKIQQNTKALDDLLKTIEKEFKNNDSYKDLKKCEDSLSKKENEMNRLVDMRIKDLIDENTFIYKKKAIDGEIEELKEMVLDYKSSVKVEKELQNRIAIFKKALHKESKINKFNDELFKNLVEKVIIGGKNDDGTINPYKITFVYKFAGEDIIDLCSPSKYQTLSINNTSRIQSIKLYF